MAKSNKRTSVEVNEQVIQDMIAGDIPGKRMPQQPPQADEQPSAPRPQDEVPQAPRLRKRKDQRDYGEMFLERLAPMPRKHTYISVEMYEKLSELLPVIARGLSIPNFLENLLSHHFETFRDEINELYSGKTQKRF